MTRWNGFLVNLLATIFIFLSVGLVELLMPDGDLILGIALLAAIGTTVTIWMVWALSHFDFQQETSDKAKRAAGADARLSLLLELLDEDERQALKRRLAEDLSTDGEMMSLADLLKAQDSAQERDR